MRVKQILALLGIAVFVAACGPDTKTDPNTDAATRLGRPDPRASWSDFTNPGRNGYGDRVFFDLDQHDVRPDQEQTVRAWAEWLKAHPGASFTVEGHADERGTREYNLGLGERRGNAVRDALNGAGASGGQLNVVSYGEERPVDRGHDESAWSKNRRVEVVYTSAQ